MAGPRNLPRRVPEGEQGFVLIAAIWLLVLAGAIVALMILRGMNDARAAKSEGELLRQKLALDGAMDTIVADRLFNGSRSQWSMAPAKRSIDIDGITVQVRSTSESGRLDLNIADLALIDRAFHGLGVEARYRRVLIGRLQQRRGNGKPISSHAELAALLAEAQRGSKTCLGDMVTMTSGLAEPRRGQMPPQLSPALGLPAGGWGAAEMPSGMLQSGEGQRVEFSTANGAGRMMVLRVTGQLRQAVAANAWLSTPICN